MGAEKRKTIAILVFSVSSVLIHVSLAPDSKERKQTELQIRGAKKETYREPEDRSGDPRTNRDILRCQTPNLNSG